MKWISTIFIIVLAIAAQRKVSADDIAELPFDLDLEELANSEEFAEDEKLLREIEAKNSIRDMDRENEIASKLNEETLQSHILSPVAEIDPCEKMHCGAGRICQTKGEIAECVCIPDCPEETDKRRHVCTNKNETWSSDCSVYQQRCLCTSKQEGCLNPENTHLHIDYYGECRKLETCSEEDMKDFPRRMRDWLFNVMRDLAERDELTEHYMQMEIEAETNMTRRWSNAAVWKWCDLDGDTDRSVSRHELFPIRAPLVSLEHCIAPFLESCDADNDHRVSLVEWGGCLELELDDLNERCDNIHKTVPQLLG